eukprot:173480_1
MSAPFPSRYDLKWAGCSLVIATLLWVLVGVSYTIFKPALYHRDLYDLKSEEQVVQLHQVFSSEDIRTVTEISAAMYWISFPFYLIAIYGIKKVLLSMFIDTPMEMWIYVLEKSYLFSLLVTNIIAPAIMLITVSFEWSIHEYTPEPDFVPTGYYIQLYAMTLVFELYDSVCVADGLFLFLICIIPQFRYCTKDPKFNILRQHGACKTCYHICLITLATSILIVFIVSLFRFANHGFFSLTGGASFLPVYGIILKFFIGVKLVRIGYSKRFDELEKVFGNKNKMNNDDKMLTGATGDYNMDTINNENPQDDANL